MRFPNLESVPMEHMQAFSKFVPECIRDQWVNCGSWLKDAREYLKHPDWKVYSKSKDGKSKLFTRVSEDNLFCMKNVAHVEEPIDLVFEALSSVEIKKRWDDGFDNGVFAYVYMPFETSMAYLRMKKILVVSPRDLLLLGRTIRVTDNDYYLLAKSMEHPNVPVMKGVVRADTPFSGWRIKQIDAGDPATGRKPVTKIQFMLIADFKVSLFIQKTVAPKSARHADMIAAYIRANPLATNPYIKRNMKK